MTTSEKIVLPAILKKYSPRNDKSVLLSFETQELSSGQIVEIHEKMGMYGGLVFKPEGQLTVGEIDEIDTLDIEAHGKTKSQRLRSALFVLHQQEGTGDFKDFYAEKMELLITQVKNRLE